jgi:hypothetical protein
LVVLQLPISILQDALSYAALNLNVRLPGFEPGTSTLSV